jgi:hypothetical protein
MSSTKKFWVVIVVFLVFCFGFTLFTVFVEENEYTLYSEVVEVNNGYGYKIMQGDKILVLQEFVPSLPGQQAFTTREQALAVANLVMSKLESGKSPIIVPSDLTKLKISAMVNN